MSRYQDFLVQVNIIHATEKIGFEGSELVIRRFDAGIIPFMLQVIGDVKTPVSR